MFKAQACDIVDSLVGALQADGDCGQEVQQQEDEQDEGHPQARGRQRRLNKELASVHAVSGLGVVGRDRYSVFPLRGKLLNVREGNLKQVADNAEINALLKILGLQYNAKYDKDDDMKTLRYGKVMVMADQDQDGSHIKGLVINFIHHNWPNLVRRNFVEEFITPIVKATNGKEEISFFSIPEYNEWRNNTDNWKSFKIKYYKRLGTSTSKEANFSDMARHRIRFKYAGPEGDIAVDMAFSKKKIEERKCLQYVATVTRLTHAFGRWLPRRRLEWTFGGPTNFPMPPPNMTGGHEHRPQRRRRVEKLIYQLSIDQFTREDDVTLHKLRPDAHFPIRQSINICILIDYPP